MVDKLSAEFASDAPGQLVQARTARCKNQRKLRRHVEIFSDNPHAIRYVRDRAIARQRADPELNLCRPLTGATFAFSPIRKHPTHPYLLILSFGNLIENPLDFG